MTKTTMTTTENTAAQETEVRANTLNIKEYMPHILGIKKNTLKFPVSSIEELSDIMEYVFDQRITNINQNISVGFSDNKNWNSKFQVKSAGKIYTVYSYVSDAKLRQALKA